MIDLQRFLINRDVPEYLYSFGDPRNGEHVGIVAEDGGYLVYDGDRGMRNNASHHDDPAMAERDFLHRLSTLLTDYGQAADLSGRQAGTP